MAPAEVARVRFRLLYKENPAFQDAWRPCVAGFAFYSEENLETERAQVARVKFADYRERLSN